MPADTPNPGKPPEEFYIVGPGDKLAIVFWKEKELTGSVKVRPDGYVTLPLINEVQVTGLTTARLRALLEEKYKEFLADPFVSVRVEEVTSSEVYLIGEVAKAGAYPLHGNLTVLELLTRSGGLNIYASRSNIRVVRREGDKIKEYTVDYDAIVAGDFKQDILLRPGDRVIVP